MKKLIFLLAAGIVFLMQYSAKAQDSVEVVIVSHLVGPFIEPEEHDYYNIFSVDNNFLLAYFTRDSIDLYSAHIIYFDDKGLQERKINIKEKSLVNLGERINNNEKFKAGNYKIGSDPAILEFVWIKKDDININVLNQQKTSSDYPLLKKTDADYKKFFSHYPRFGMGLGLTYLNFNFDELLVLTNAIDNYYYNKGFYVSPRALDYKAGPVFRFKGLVDFTSTLSASLMVEYNISNSDINYNSFTLMGLYTYKDLSEYFNPFAGVGYTRNNFNITVDYGSATVDTLGGMLESVKVDGGTEGLIAEAGIKALFGNSFSIGIAADYYFLTTYKYKVNYISFNSEIKPGNFGAGIFINILF